MADERKVTSIHSLDCAVLFKTIMAPYKPVTHVIFDMDGLILDTVKMYKSMTHAIASRYGKECSWEVMWKIIGAEVTNPTQATIDELQLPMTEKEFVAACEELYEEHFSQAELMPGVERLINHLQTHGIPIAVATGSRKRSYDVKTRKHQDLMRKFHHIVHGPDDPEVKRQKSAPDIYLVCNSRFENPPPPEKVLVFEDSPGGVKAGINAGMQVVMVPHPQQDPDACKQATLVLRSLEEFRPELFGLPPFPEP